MSCRRLIDCSLSLYVVFSSFSIATSGLFHPTLSDEDTVALPKTDDATREKPERSDIIERWVDLGLSKSSATFLGENNVSKVLPTMEFGVFADGKTVTIRGELSEDKETGTNVYNLHVDEAH